MQEKAESGFHAIILAAGQSSRMKREKAALPWLDGMALLPWMVQALSDAGWQTNAVVGPASFVHWNNALPAGCAVLNPDPARGKTTSLACGIEKLPSDTKWILLGAVDQPRFPQLYHRLRQEAATSSAKILVPTNEGHRGHPVVLSGALRTELLSLNENSHGLRGLLDAYRSETYRLPEDETTESSWDMNTPNAYEEAFAIFRKHRLSTLNSQRPL